jgi:hypothetical protein
MAIQDVSVATVHTQSRAPRIVSVPVPPPALNEDGEVDAETWHLSEDGAARDADDEVQATDVTARMIAKPVRARNTDRCGRAMWLPRSAYENPD